jgi:hypothetical protein
MQKFEVTGPVVNLFHGLIELTESQAHARAFALEETEEPNVFSIKKPISFKKGEVFSFDGEPGKAARQMLESVDEHVLLSVLAKGLGLKISEAVQLLKEKYDTILQNNGKAPVDPTLAKKVAEDHNVTLPTGEASTEA